jgi:tetratricopeptide (TPR) repeat protein
MHIIRSLGSGRRSSNARLAASYKREWCDAINILSFTKLGFAVYEAAQYDEALYIFQRMQQKAEEKGQFVNTDLALVWQGHMLDLLGRRAEAIACYKRVAMMCSRSGFTHDQYGLRYRVSPYAVERMVTPFVRIENKWDD